MKQNLKPVALLLCCGMLLLAGCHEKKKPVLPPQATAPPANTQPQPSQPQPEVKPQEPPATTQEPAQTEQKPSPATPKHPKPRAAARKPAPKPTTTEKPPEVAVNTPPRIIIQEGGTDNSSASGRVAPLNSHTEAAHSQATIEQLLDSTETNLRGIKRQLSDNEQADVKKIRDFVTQARQAIKDSDLVRAHILAMKAHLLSDELVKQK